MKENFFLKPVVSDPVWMNDLDEEELITRNYDKSKLSKSSYDVIIIGSGIGGISAASMLSQQGKTVLVLESTDHIGGLTYSFKEGDYEFETGVHVLMNCIEEKGSYQCFSRVLFDQLTEKKVKFARVGQNGKHETIHFQGKSYEPIYNGRSSTQRYFEEQFPEEDTRKNIRKFFSLVKSVTREWAMMVGTRELPIFLRKPLIFFLQTVLGYRIFKLNKTPVRELSKSLFPKNKVLRNLLFLVHCLVGDYQKCPSSISMICNSQFSSGVMFPIHGSNDMIKKMCRVIVKYRGDVFCNASVKRILLKKGNNVAIGVELENGDIIHSKNIMSCCGIKNTYNFLPRSLRPPSLSKLEDSSSHFMVFLGFRGSWKDLGLPPHHLFFIEKDLSTEEEFFKSPNDNLPPWLFFSHLSPTKIENKNKTTLVGMFPTNETFFKNWNGTSLKQRGNEYIEEKRKFEDVMLKILYKYYPKCEEFLDVCVSGTRLSTEWWAGTPNGCSMGIRATEEKFYKIHDQFLRGKKVKNLFFGGQDRYVCPGVSPAIIGSVLGVSDLTGRNMMEDLTDATRYFVKTRKFVRENF